MTRELKPGDLGVTIYDGPRVEKPCANCPFTEAAKGRPYLTRKRIEDILFAVTLGQPFYCHKTVYNGLADIVTDTDTGGEERVWHTSWRMCAGAIGAAEAIRGAREGAEWLDVGKVAERIGAPPEAWVDACIAVCNEMALAFPELHAQRIAGQWTGPVAAGTHFRWLVDAGLGKNGLAHWWLVLLDGTVLDPTRWVYEGRAPYIYHGPADFYVHDRLR